MNKRIRSILAALLAAAMLTGCSAQTQEPQMKIYVICKSQDPYWDTTKAGALEAGEEMNLDVIYEAPASEEEIDTQIQMINDALADGAQAIVLAPLDTDELNDTLRFAGRQDKVNHEAAAHPKENSAEEQIISYLCGNPDYFRRIKDILPPEKFVTEFNRRVYSFIYGRMASGEDWTMAAMNESFSFEELGSIARIQERVRAEGIDEQTADECVQALLSYVPKPGSGSDVTIDELEALRQNKRKKLSQGNQ